MSIFPTKLSRLTRLFEVAGARAPAEWAKSELEEDIPQLARFMFLRQAWRSIIPDGDTSWIDLEVQSAKRNPTAPGSGLGLALERLTAAGANAADLSEVARAAQWQLLHSICYQLSDPSIEEEELQHVGWRLFEVDAQGKIGRPVEGLHESVLETDPTGREMRPRESS
jgi:hypothetical protein